MKTADNNDDELRKLAPKLSSLEKKDAFSVPEGYFDSLSNQLMDKISDAPELEKSAVLNPFIVPENYFEKLPVNISNRIKVAQAKRFSLADLLAQVLRPKYSLTLITACLAVFICIRFFEKPIRLNVSSATAESISVSEADVLDQVDENTLLNAVSEESASVIKSNKAAKGDKSMEDYIINNNIDISDIAKEL